MGERDMWREKTSREKERASERAKKTHWTAF